MAIMAKKNPFSYAIDYDRCIREEEATVAACEHPVVAKVVEAFAGQASDYTTLLMFLFDNRGFFEDADLRRSFDSVARRVRRALNSGRLSEDLSEWSDANEDFEVLWPCDYRDGCCIDVDFERSTRTEYILVAMLMDHAAGGQLHNLGKHIKRTRSKTKRDLSRHRRNQKKYAA